MPSQVVVSHDRCKADQVPAGVVFAMLLSFFWTSLVIQNLLHCTVAVRTCTDGFSIGRCRH